MAANESHKTTAEAALRLGRDELGHDTGREVHILLSLATGWSRSQILASPEQFLSDETFNEFQRFVKRRRDGEPIAYIAGEREFWSLPLFVSAATLIPRPETETLVEQALARIEPNTEKTVLDLGTGCGAVALAIASERADSRVIGVDVSVEALQVAELNRARLGLKNVRWLESDWYHALAGRRFDLIVSNPPYVADDDPHLREGDLPHEPPIALSSGRDGLDAIKIVIAGASQHLTDNGWLLLEHGFDQSDAVQSLFNENGFDEISTSQDLAGQPRISVGRKVESEEAARHT